MARSKEQWKAQTRISQAARPGAPPPGVRPSAPHWAAPLQVKAANFAAVRLSTTSQVIDLTEDDEEVDEPMGETAVGETAKRQEVTSQQTGVPTRPAEAMAVMGEDVESDIDEEWPAVPPASGVETKLETVAEDEDTGVDGAQTALEETQQVEKEQTHEQPPQIHEQLAQVQEQEQQDQEQLPQEQKQQEREHLPQPQEQPPEIPEQAQQTEVQPAEHDARKTELQAEEGEKETQQIEKQTQQIEEGAEKAMVEARVAQLLQEGAQKAQEEAQENQVEEQKTLDAKAPENDVQDVADVSMEQSGRLSLEDSDDEMEADVDEELPNHATSQGEDATSTSPDTGGDYRVVQLESLEDGEIYEEGVKKASMVQTQPVMKDHFVDSQSMDGSKYLTARHMRGKKQKKRGKKKAKRKLDAMQAVPGPPGEMQPQYDYQYGQPEFERVSRPRLFANAPAPGPYTFAMMNNAPRGAPVRPVFQVPGPAPFQPTNQFVGPPRPMMAPPPQQIPVPRPPPPFGDSQFLRVNRQGGMQMFNGVGRPPIHRALSDPPQYGGFKYRSVPVSPSKGSPSAPSGSLSYSVNSSEGHGPPLPPPTGAGASNPASKTKRVGSDDFDLDSLRAAALKTKRAVKTPTPTSQKTSGLSSPSSPSSPDLAHAKRRHSEPSSPEIDELREEILRSMQRNRQRSSNNSTGNGPATVPGTDGDGMKKPERNSEALAGSDAKPSSTSDSTDKPQVKTVVSKKTEGSDASKTATPESAVASRSERVGSTHEATTPEFRPLTACSQSVVIRLSLDDFSPRKNSKHTETSAVGTAATAGQTYNDAIEEMRRQIAEREKIRAASRLAMSEAGKLSNRSSSSSVSSASTSPSPRPDAPVEAPVESVVQQEVSATAVEKVKVPLKPSGGGDPEPTKSCVSASTKEKQNGAQDPPPITSELKPDQQTTSITTDLPPKPAPKQLTKDDSASGDASMVSSPVDPSEMHVNNVSVDEQLLSEFRDADGRLDFDAIQAEYNQCAADVEEADDHIARLTIEIEQLTKKPSPVESTS